jgi:peroxiredoxin
VKQVADFVNEQKRDFELLDDIQEQVNSKFDLVSEHRKLISEAEVAGYDRITTPLVPTSLTCHPFYPD